MNILLDTHIALWSMYDDNRLDSTAVSMLTDENNIIFVSLVSAWEIAIKTSIGKLHIPADGFMEDCKSMGYHLLPMKEKHVAAVQHLCDGPEGHKDPFDRFLLAQAEAEGIKFLTRDRKILKYDNPVILRS